VFALAGSGLGAAAEIGAAAFGPVGTTGGLTMVTSWAPEGVDPTIESGRWVMLGDATPVNYALSGVIQKGYPLANAVTQYVLSSDLAGPKPEGGGPLLDAFKYAIGQRSCQ
jgi:hypothetical protein